MLRLIKKYIRTVLIILVIVVGLVLVVSAASMLSQYANEIIVQAQAKAEKNTMSARTDVEFAIDECQKKAIVVATAVSFKNSRADLYSYLSTINQQKGYADVYSVRYFKNGTLYSYEGNVFNGTDISRVVATTNPDTPAFVGVFEDSSRAEEYGTVSIVGFYAPVANSELVDGIVVYYVRNKLEEFYDPDTEEMSAEFSVLSTASGEVIVGREQIENTQVLTVLRNRIAQKEPVDEISSMMDNSETGSISVKIGTQDYIVSIGADYDRMKNLCVVELYNVRDLCKSSFDFIDSVIGIFIIFAVATAAIVLYLYVRRRIIERKYYNLDMKDDKLNCSSRAGFEKQAQMILDRNKTSYFAVSVFEIKHFDYIQEECGLSETDHLLNYLRVTCSKLVQFEETYGYLGEGRFLLLLHTKDRDALIERLKIHAFLATQYKGLHKFDVILKYGIFEAISEDIHEVSRMIDFALEANEAIVRASEQNATMQFNFYNDELRKIRILNEQMELRMEGALKDGEFQVFYQPKYNLNIDKQDGAEALVRWYDPKTKEYNKPALFMPLFESNGFIVKLDKYVYSKVCEYISYSIANGRPVFPVSVNVSRITAVQPDFIEYYSKTKKKYNIRDGQIMIEFTESFAYENYTTLFKIVEQLHENGFKCSIDDFGSGYSSYRILKELPMDEIKLDSFFLRKGWADEVDQHILEVAVQLGKKLNMKVTQEGVETPEEIERIRAVGVDVVQGYYYSHPLPLTDYLNFVAASREHNLNTKI